MNNSITYSICPACHSTKINLVFTSRDYTVSQNDFQIFECSNCTLRFTQNVPNEENIANYYKHESYISHTNEAKGLINTLYHLVRNYTLISKRKLISQFVKSSSKKILDIGAGTGYFLNEMKQNGWEVLGLEPSEDARKVAFTTHQIELKDSSNLNSLSKNYFAVITMWHVFEHVHKSKEYFEIMFDCLTEKGVLVIAVPNYTSKDAEIYEQKWAAYDVPRHVFHFSPQSLIQLAMQNGFSIKKIKPMWFDSFYVCMLSEKNSNGKLSISGFLRAVFIGFYSNLIALFNNQKCSSLIYIFEKS